MRRLIALSLLLLSGPAPRAQAPQPNLWSLESPDGRTMIAVVRQPDGHLNWRATRERQPVLADSPLGIRRADQDFTGALTFLSATEPTAIDDRYTTPGGKRRDHHVVARERTLSFANAAGAKLDVVLHAQDDGVAFRYRFPGSGDGTKTVVEERTGFHLPLGSIGWMMPQQDGNKYGPADEDFYVDLTAGTLAARAAGWAFPALFKTASNKWVLLTESALDDAYCGSHLAQDATGDTYRIAFPDPKEGMGVGKVEPESTLPWTLPWRVAIIGDAAGRILESDLVNDLAPATRMADASWVKPGRAAWSWWSKSDSPKHAEDLDAFTDLAAGMGWEYALVDPNWNLMASGQVED